jgi:hypothetical protein
VTADRQIGKCGAGGGVKEFDNRRLPKEPIDSPALIAPIVACMAKESRLFTPLHTELTAFRIGSPDQKRTPNVTATARHLGLRSFFFDSRHE